MACSPELPLLLNCSTFVWRAFRLLKSERVILVKSYNQAEEAAQDILLAFQRPESLPKPLAQIFIHRKDDAPCRRWSWRNQLIAAIRGHNDARGFKQWEQVGRKVRKGEKAFRILSPLTKKVMDETKGKERTLVYGWRGTPVFGLDQTEGEPVDTSVAEAEWLSSLPLIDVATTWGLTVASYGGSGANVRGKYRHGKAIALGVENLSTWAHELVHAADYRNGKLKELGQHWRSETVAELGGAVLLTALGLEHDADLGGCWEYVKQYASRCGIEVVDACNKVLIRTCEAVALILDTAEQIKRGCAEEAVA